MNKKFVYLVGNNKKVKIKSVYYAVKSEYLDIIRVNFSFKSGYIKADDNEDLEYMTRKLKESYEKWGLDMNLNKTK